MSASTIGLSFSSPDTELTISRKRRPKKFLEMLLGGERYFHMPDPDGHELSFAQPLQRHPATAYFKEGSEAH